MSDIIVGEQRESEAFFCPKCYAPVDLGKVGTITLAANAQVPVSCSACVWYGDIKQLARSTFKHEFKSDEEIAQAMMVDLRNLLAKNAAVTYGAFLSKWGFLDQPPSAVQLGRYMMEIAKTTARTVIDLRKTMVEEKARERSGG